MQVDFYHLTRDPVEKLVPMLAEKSLTAGQRVLVICEDETQRSALSESLWKHDPASFLAHDLAGSDQEAGQPILIASSYAVPNEAKFVIIADGQWRDEVLVSDRVFYLFAAQDIDAARTAWRALSGKEDVSPRYWKQDGGRWVEGP